ncbi:MAG: guanylate kinase [Candidatus Omnitrophica bacterium]|nr:guanylate kinase [Candidatus Omnitrophota bacterium]
MKITNRAKNTKLENNGLASDSQSQGKIFVISGPSGSGKTTLLSKLTQDKEISKLLIKSRSLTTRPKRSQERQGKDYFFVTSFEFKRLIKQKKILEWTRYLGYYYGTPKQFVDAQLKKGKNIGFCLDLKGAAILKKIYPKNTVTIFVLPPSLETLKTRIQKRCNCTAQQEVVQRLKLARREIKACSRFDHCILNKNLQVASDKLKEIIKKAISPTGGTHGI